MRIDEQFGDMAGELKGRATSSGSPSETRNPADGDSRLHSPSPSPNAYTLEDEADAIVDRVITAE